MQYYIIYTYIAAAVS